MKPEVKRLYEYEEKKDLHIHLAWTDFMPEDQAKRSRREQDEQIISFLKYLRQQGYTLVRDAGGMTQKELDRILVSYGIDHREIPEVICCGGMLNEQNCHDESAIRDILAGPEQWVKIFATGGVGMSPEQVLKPLMDKDTFITLVKRLHDVGKLVMVHTYGGASLDWAIEAGVESVEHGVYMTEVQAKALADHDILYVPTEIIYSILAGEDNPFKLPDELAALFQANAKSAVKALRNAVSYAHQYGVAMAYGSDFFSFNTKYEEYNVKVTENEREALCTVVDGKLVIEPVNAISGGEFAEQILADLIAEGLSGEVLLNEFHHRQNKVRPAIEAMLNEAKLVAEGKTAYSTYEDVFGTEE